VCTTRAAQALNLLKDGLLSAATPAERLGVTWGSVTALIDRPVSPVNMRVTIAEASSSNS
jgi:hypothetical protein